MFKTLGTVYLIHLDQSFYGRLHYIGWAPPIASINPDAKDLEEGFKQRIQRHRNGTGSQLLSNVNRAKIDWQVVMIWTQQTLQDEKRLKSWKKSRQLCPVCSPINIETHGGIPVPVPVEPG